MKPIIAETILFLLGTIFGVSVMTAIGLLFLETTNSRSILDTEMIWEDQRKRMGPHSLIRHHA